MRRAAAAFLFLFLFLFLSSVGAGGSASEGPPPIIAVLYPATEPPYRQLFAEILDGIKQGATGATVRTLALSEPPDIPALRRWLDQQVPAVTISLGRVPTEAYEHLGSTIPHVVGALDASPQTRPRVAGVGLAVDPVLLLATLKRLVPTTRRVWVVFNPNTDRWLIDLARAAAPTFGLTVQALEASDLRGSAQRFLDILDRAEPATDALWLVADATVIDTQTILPLVVERGWQRRLAIFSDSLQHAQHGILFALYPDPLQLGHRLAKLAQSRWRNPQAARRIEPLRAVKRALNLKIAAHLGLNVMQDIERQFDVVLPPW